MTRRPWTPEALAEVCRRYPHERTADIARDLGRSIGSIHGQANMLGLKKSPEYMREIHGAHIADAGARYRFNPGSTAWNKGIPGSTGNHPNTRRTIGRVRVKLAALLQKHFPYSGSGLALTWEPEQLYPATGRYRTDWRMDCARWEGFARHYKSDGTFWTVLSVHSYTPMSELIKASALQITADGEVGEVTPN